MRTYHHFDGKYVMILFCLVFEPVPLLFFVRFFFSRKAVALREVRVGDVRALTRSRTDVFVRILENGRNGEWSTELADQGR